ncbi:cryptochrome/photolyase family protein [Paenibacillus xylanexedens]|uniref:cryptochrome/photolyase family protein n=1 Tax=Paenibacillus xylanexedens TaxID=528191 RepID=UPI000F54B208|nr:deoxyribodipyrimidine photo-lyase [Paenibacillus xylanexedens]RPK26191.1 Deoxyribodipyrimidine photolyase [Paenibacillus xylanexedens]
MKLFIHRKDLRTDDLAAFDYLRENQEESVHVLIYDPFLLRQGREKEHSGVNFRQHAVELGRRYFEAKRNLHVAYGKPTEVVEFILNEFKGEIDEIVVHRDMTPYAIERDRAIRKVSEAHEVSFTQLTDHLLMDLNGFANFTGKSEPYKVFAAFHRRWVEFMNEHPNPPSATTVAELNVSDRQIEWPNAMEVPPELLEGSGSSDEDPHLLLDQFLSDRIAEYGDHRDEYEAYEPSHLSSYVAVGAVSIRKMYDAASRTAEAGEWIRQLCFRDFYLYRAVYESHYFTYEKVYDLSALHDDHFERWCKAETGIPIIDAAMTELNETGHMPNRLRILTAMFLTKNLQCPFTLGEAYFRRKLSDYDNIQNRGNWLWCASLGENAAPYFRVNNPVTQSEKYDPQGDYIRKWLPELKDLHSKDIHQPRKDAIVDLKASRQAAIDVYKQILASRGK